MASNSSNQRDPDELRHEIDQTRANMSRTVTLLEARLNPQALKQQAADSVRKQTVGRAEGFADNASRTVKGASADVLDTIKQNPLPAALAVIGLGWLFMESRDRSQNKPRYSGRYAGERVYGERYAGIYPTGYGVEGDEYGYERGRYERMPGDRMRGAAGNVQDKAGRMAGQVQDRAGEMAGSVQDKAGEMAGRVQDKAGEMAGRMQDKAGQMADEVSYKAHDAAGRVADEAQERAYRVKSRFEDLLDDNPLLVGATAAALGVMLGLSVPASPQENRVMGPARDKMLDKAQDAAQDTMQKVQQVAEKAGEAAKDTAKNEAQKQNLASS